MEMRKAETVKVFSAESQQQCCLFHTIFSGQLIFSLIPSKIQQ
jgi:hypothetical protein